MTSDEHEKELRKIRRRARRDLKVIEEHRAINDMVRLAYAAQEALDAGDWKHLKGIAEVLVLIDEGQPNERG